MWATISVNELGAYELHCNECSAAGLLLEETPPWSAICEAARLTCVCSASQVLQLDLAASLEWPDVVILSA